MWQIDEVRSERPTVLDEVKGGLAYYPSAIDAVPRLYAELALGLSEAYGTKVEARSLPQLLHFGSWIGGDGDGNPNVTAQTLQDALRLAKGVILEHYHHLSLIHILDVYKRQRLGLGLEVGDVGGIQKAHQKGERAQRVRQVLEPVGRRDLALGRWASELVPHRRASILDRHLDALHPCLLYTSRCV